MHSILLSLPMTLSLSLSRSLTVFLTQSVFFVWYFMQVIFALSSCSFWLCIALILGTRKHAHTLLHLHPHIHTYTRTHRQRNSCWGSHIHRVKCKFLSSDLFLVRVFRAPISGSPRPTNTHATPFLPPPVPRIYRRKSKIELEHYGRAKQRLRYAWGTGVSHVFSRCISFCFDMPEYLA